MSEKNPTSKKAAPPAETSPGGRPRTLLCEEWEALLVDALDGTLEATESAAFNAHRDSCLACAQLLEEAKRGSEWLHFLETEPEVPADLIGRILAKTSGAEDTIPAMVPAGLPMAVPSTVGWAGGWLPMMEKRAAQSRWIMTAAMAFFSLAFMLNSTLNMTGVKLTELRIADLKPSALAIGLGRQIRTADRNVHQYYDNLRWVYELESRVQEMRRDVQTETPAQNGSQGGAQGTGDKQPPAKHTGGSAQVPDVTPDSEPEGRPEPTLAKFEKEDASKTVAAAATGGTLHPQAVGTSDVEVKWNGGRKHVQNKRPEGSLA